MAKKEWTPENWKWDEEKIRKYLEEFKKYLNSKDGQKEVKERREKLSMAQELLKDEESIESLTSEKLSSLLKTLDASKRSPVPTRIMSNEEYFKEFKTWLKNLIKVKSQETLPEKSPEDIGIGYASELLTLRNPKEFYLINNASIAGINKLGFGELPAKNEESYPKWRPLFDELKEKIKSVIEKNLNKEVDYYDVDHFLFYVHKSKISQGNNETKEDITEESVPEDQTSDQKNENHLTLQRYFQYKGFYFNQDLITAFYSALKTKGFVILSGLTGTGKTKLAQLFAELLCPNCNPQDKQNTQTAQTSSENQNQCKCTHLFLPVRPDWRDSKALLGYYNPITRRYERTPLLDFILEAMEDYNRNKKDASPYFIILDEMNLSHVEYYFAVFLSVLESGRDDNYWTKETIKLHNSEEVLLDNNGDEIPKEIELPPNLYIIGSVNIDETTYMFSPKVLDRAFTIEFRDVNFNSYLASLQKGQNNISEDELTKLRNALLNDLRNNGKFCAAVGDKSEIKNAINVLEQEIKGELSKLNQILQPYNLHFGYRVLDEIALFVKYATSAPVVVGKLDKKDALDFAVLMKVLPKFHGPRQKLERPLWLVLNWCLGKSAEFENKTFDDLVDEIWEILTDQKKRPSIEDLTNVIQKLKSELNNRSKNESKEANPESQTIDENQNRTTEELPESTSEAHQTEQTSKTENTPIIDKFKYPRTAIKVLTMLRQLYETGFTSFA
jgi:5-methylcytosine-specific restriction endonuclease McrBC GTP-binding regulatory subunit McrB